MGNIISKEVQRWMELGARPGVWYEVQGHYHSYRRYRSWFGVTIVTYSRSDKCTVGVTSDMLCPSISSNQTETNLAMPGLVPTLLVLENGDPPWVYVHSADTHCCTRILIKIHSVDTGHTLAVDSLLDSGAAGMFILMLSMSELRNSRYTLYHMPYLFTIWNAVKG